MRIQINKLNANKCETKEDYELTKNFNTLGDMEAKRSSPTGCGKSGSWQTVVSFTVQTTNGHWLSVCY